MALMVSMAGPARTWSVKYRCIIVFGHGMFVIAVNLLAAAPDSIIFVFLAWEVVAPLAADGTTLLVKVAAVVRRRVLLRMGSGGPSFTVAAALDCAAMLLLLGPHLRLMLLSTIFVD